MSTTESPVRTQPIQNGNQSVPSSAENIASTSSPTQESIVSPAISTQSNQSNSQSERSTPPSRTNGRNEFRSDQRIPSMRSNSSLSSTTSNSPKINSTLKSAIMRLTADLAAIEQGEVEGISASPVSDGNLFMWRAIIMGPEDSPWEGGVFSLTLHFPENFPLKPPTVKFISKMFHPNVFADGSLCLDILTQEKWSPAMSVQTILTSIQSLLNDPNVASPANTEASKLFTENPKEYRKRVRKCVEASMG